MTIWAVVPVKPLRFGKSRLARVLSEESRLALNHCLLSNTLQTLKSIPEIEQVLVVSRDPQALALARNHGARTVQENGTPHLNIALERAMVILKKYAIYGALVIPADLPLLQPEDIRRLLKQAHDPPVVGIVPDRHGEGTNALLVYPTGTIHFSFGENSFDRHCELARLAGARLEVCKLESMALDIDIPEDMMLVREALDCNVSMDFRL